MDEHFDAYNNSCTQLAVGKPVSGGVSFKLVVCQHSQT
jgi:hypothetical protein